MAQHGVISTDIRLAGAAISPGGLIRSLLLGAVFLLLWISFVPFSDRSLPPEVTEQGSVVNQIGYSLLFVVLAAWCIVNEPARLLLLLRPTLIVMLLWLAMSVVASSDPSLSARRLMFTLLTIGFAAIVLLLPRNARHFADVLAAVTLTVLAACYIGVFIAPTFSIHQPTDFTETELAGDWRGIFGHKNEASATMVLFVFIGLFIARMRSVAVGLLIVALSFVFLIFTHSKTSILMLPLTFAVAALLPRIRRPFVGVAFALSIVIGVNLFSVGSIYIEPIRNLLDATMADPSFTGRTDIWEFAISRLAQHPIVGYGFAAFWNTPEVIYGMKDNWANTASHAHNGYLDLAITIGIPGAILVVVWLIVLPILDFYRSPHDAAVAPLETLFLRVCLFAAYASCFESRLLQEGTGGFFLFTAAFGLRLLSVSRAAT